MFSPDFHPIIVILGLLLLTILLHRTYAVGIAKAAPLSRPGTVRSDRHHPCDWIDRTPAFR